MSKTILVSANGAGQTTNANITSYKALSYTFEGATETTENNTKVLVNYSGVFSRLYIRVSANTVTATSTLRLRINGADGNQVISIASSTTGSFQDTSNTDTISAGDSINYKFVSGATGTSLTITVCSIQFNSDTNTVAIYGASSTGGITINSASTTQYVAMTSPSSDTTESNTQAQVNNASTLNHFNIYISANARTTTTTFRVRKNTANGNQSVSVTSGATGSFQDTSNTDVLSANDLINFSWTTGTGTEALVIQFYSVQAESTDNTFSTFGGFVGGASFDTTSPDYMAVASQSLFGTGTADATASVPIDFDGTFSNFWINISANTYNVAAVLRLRNNVANTNLAVSITASTTGTFEDTSNTATIASGDDVNISQTTYPGSGSMTVRLFSFLFTGEAEVVQADNFFHFFPIMPCILLFMLLNL
jgi:hypothetical protein